MLAAIRPDEQSFALLLHLVGAVVVFGALLASATSILLARGDTRLLRLGYFSLLLVGLPGLILMRLAGQWLYNLQKWDEGRSALPCLPRARWRRCLPVAPRQERHRPAQRNDAHLAPPDRRLRRRRLGNDRQAELGP